MVQIDYSGIGVFLNASLTPLPWWPKTPGLTFEPALKPQAAVADRGHPKWYGPASGSSGDGFTHHQGRSRHRSLAFQGTPIVLTWLGDPSCSRSWRRLFALYRGYFPEQVIRNWRACRSDNHLSQMGHVQVGDLFLRGPGCTGGLRTRRRWSCRH